jgi:hypothetical protein
MSTYYRILLMVQIMVYCEICESNAIFTNYEGESRCVRCFPYREK